MYSSKEGAAVIDLRGSSCLTGSGSRVSNIPPAPLIGAPPWAAGAAAGGDHGAGA
jgi:hypothetical protein